MFQKISRYIAPCILAAASLLASGCPQKPKQTQLQNPRTSTTQQLSPETTDPDLPTNQDYRTVSTSRSVRSGSTAFPVELRVEGPERVKRRQKAVYTASVEKLPSEYIAIGAAANLGDVEFFPEGDGFKRLPPNGEFVRVGDSRYPFEEFAKLLPGYEESRGRNLGDLKIISSLGRDRITREVLPNLPSWYSDPAFTPSDFSLFTIHGSTGFSGAKQEIVCSANRDTSLKLFALLRKSMEPENVLLTGEFPIDVIEDRQSEGLAHTILVGKEANLQYIKLAMSPREDRVAFSAIEERGQNRRGVVGVVDLDGGNQRVFPYDSWPTLLAWSPDGKLVHNRASRFWLLNPENGNEHQISVKYPTGIPKSLAWFPGDKILYSQDLTRDEKRLQEDIFSMDPQTGEVVNLTKTDDLNETDPVWSPDGKKIAFTSINKLPVAGGIQELVYICVMNGDGLRRVDLTEHQPKVFGGWIQNDVWFIGDSGRIYTVDRVSTDGDTNRYLYTDRDYFGSDNPLILPPGAQVNPIVIPTGSQVNWRDLQGRKFALSQDGKRLAFTAATKPSIPENAYDRDLYFLDLQTKRLTRVTQGKIVEDLETTPDLDKALCVVRYADGEKLERFDLRQFFESGPEIGERTYRGRFGIADVEVIVGANKTTVRMRREEGGKMVEFLGEDEGSNGSYEKIVVNEEGGKSTTLTGNSEIVDWTGSKFNEAKNAVMGQK